jgi:C-terminal processing protease CtpA/Prc
VDFGVLGHLSHNLLDEEAKFAISTYGSIKVPGLFIYDDHSVVGYKNNNPYRGKVIILVNENTQSSAEFHAMAYRVHPNAIVMGSTTAGADGNVTRFFLPGGISTRISGIGIYYPDGTETQRVGIVPDIYIEPTIEGIREGRDEVLEKAIETIIDK